MPPVAPIHDQLVRTGQRWVRMQRHSSPAALIWVGHHASLGRGDAVICFQCALYYYLFAQLNVWLICNISCLLYVHNYNIISTALSSSSSSHQMMTCFRSQGSSLVNWWYWRWRRTMEHGPVICLLWVLMFLKSKGLVLVLVLKLEAVHNNNGATYSCGKMHKCTVI